MKLKKKTHKSTAKRFWLTGSGKLRRRKSGQNHFNSRDQQKTTKSKRNDETVVVQSARIKKLLY